MNHGWQVTDRSAFSGSLGRVEPWKLGVMWTILFWEAFLDQLSYDDVAGSWYFPIQYDTVGLLMDAELEQKVLAHRG